MQHDHGDTERPRAFPTDTAGLPEAARDRRSSSSPTATAFELRIAPVAKRIGDATVRMLAYNGSIPGPTLRVREGSELIVDVDNEGDLEATVHWHGLRLDNRYDGTHETQAADAGRRRASPTGSHFPDPGVYWYHPHIREDYGQELGLYGNIIVVPADADYWPPVHRELALTLDDVLIEDGQIAPFSRDETTYAAMGRFGNVLLVGGETDLALTAQPGEVVRFYLTNTANTRVFNVALPGARMKLVGGDSGRVEHEEFVESVILAPSERSSSTCSSTSRASGARAPHARADLPPGDDRRSARSRPTPSLADAVRSAAAEPGLGGRARAARAVPRRRAGQDARLRRRDGHGRARGTTSSTPARCTPRSSARSPATARSAA